jgi:hypothetical protein
MNAVKTGDVGKHGKHGEFLNAEGAKVSQRAQKREYKINQ